jgi:alpha-mannosidase
VIRARLAEPMGLTIGEHGPSHASRAPMEVGLATATVARGIMALIVGVACALVSPSRALAHRAYLVNDNHTDYGWNDTVENYETSMLSELDYYRGRVDATAANPPAEQAHFNADNWYYIYLYQKNRSPTAFQDLIDKVIAGNITVPLNPFVELYGAMPTEGAIRGGYYPGRIERQYGVPFLLAQQMEDQTIPWGLASLWAGSRAKYTWKGICGCVTSAPYGDRTTEVFRWQGPDNKTLLMKWYSLNDNRPGVTPSQSWGGYAEARANLTPDRIQGAIDHFAAQAPLLPMTGLFGAGWDDVNYETTAFETVAANWNAAHPGGDQVILSNGIDYFQELEGHVDQLSTQRGGWGNDWDLWVAALSERTGQVRRALEQLRTAEALSAVVTFYDQTFWPPRQGALEAGLVDGFKFFEHTWGSAGSVPLMTTIAHKKQWAQSIDTAVAQTATAAAAALGGLVATPNEVRFLVFNPLAFARTDVADLPINDTGPFIVTDVATGNVVPSQIIALNGSNFLRILAADVPSLGYRVYRYASGTAALPPAATITGTRIESARYRVDVGTRGELTSVFDKTASMEISGTGLNDFGSGTATATLSENVGPVSATLRLDIGGVPNRRVRVTLVKDADRVIIEDEILQNYTVDSLYRFNVGLTDPQIRFEEVGAIARPGSTAQGGDFLPGTRADYMTLNHFVDLADALGGYHVTLSNWDAFAMRVGNSTPTSFDLPTSEVSVLALGNPSHSDITTQGDDTYFLRRFALRGAAGVYSGADAMKMSLAHQNPLQTIALAPNHEGPLSAPTGSFLSVDAPNVVVMAFKPAEEMGRGFVVRLWELNGQDTAFTIDASAFAPSAAFQVSLIETDTGAAMLNGGIIAASIAANEIKAYRFVTGGSQPTPTGTSTSTLPPAATPTASATVTAPATGTSTAASTPTASGTATTSPPMPSATSSSGTPSPLGTATPTSGGSVVDLAALLHALFAPTAGSVFDLNRDGRVSSADVTAFIRLPNAQ